MKRKTLKRHITCFWDVGIRNYPSKLHVVLPSLTRTFVSGEIAGGDSLLTVGLEKLSIQEAADKGAKTFVIGLANAGGYVEPEWEPYIVAAIEAGMDIASGLHRKLEEFPAIQEAAEKHGVALHNVRHGYTDLKTGTGEKTQWQTDTCSWNRLFSG